MGRRETQEQLDLERIGRHVSYILRHKPESIGSKLDDEGWLDVGILLAGLEMQGIQLDAEGLTRLVEDNDKKRYSFSEDKMKIRANQGHSIDVDLGLMPVNPPDRLFHGTTERAMSQISVQGLRGMGRTHVHLSEDQNSARIVANRRRGSQVILAVDAKGMTRDGLPLLRSENGVWLASYVPPQYLTIEQDEGDQT